MEINEDLKAQLAYTKEQNQSLQYHLSLQSKSVNLLSNPEKQCTPSLEETVEHLTSKYAKGLEKFQSFQVEYKEKQDQFEHLNKQYQTVYHSSLEISAENESLKTECAQVRFLLDNSKRTLKSLKEEHEELECLHSSVVTSSCCNSPSSPLARGSFFNDLSNHLKKEVQHAQPEVISAPSPNNKPPHEVFLNQKETSEGTGMLQQVSHSSLLILASLIPPFRKFT